MTQPARPTVDIAICTFRRPQLRQTLASVAALETEGLAVRVIVSDNDTGPSAQALIEAERGAFPFPLTYLHSPAQNISLARNACLDAAAADFIAFVDDDETVTPGWLTALIAQAEATGADVVLGPVRALYGEDSPPWIARGDFHSVKPVFVGDQIETGYTCNALIRRTPAVAPLRFDLALGRSGGEDTDFFYRLRAKGSRIAYAPEALVEEVVPGHRARLSWLISRRFRAGQTHGLCLMRVRRVSALQAAGLASAKVVHCLVMTSVTVLSPVRWRRNLLRATLHMGVLGGILGVRQQVQYGHAQYR